MYERRCVAACRCLLGLASCPSRYGLVALVGGKVRQMLMKLVLFFGGILRNDLHTSVIIHSNHKGAGGTPHIASRFFNYGSEWHWPVFRIADRALGCRHDLEAIDFTLVKSLKSIRDIHVGGLLTEEAFRDMGLGGFEVVTANGLRVDLPTPGGASREVTRDNRLEFADLVEAYKMREYRVPVRIPSIFCLD